MPKRIDGWKCEYCGKIFPDFETCNEHEHDTCSDNSFSKINQYPGYTNSPDWKRPITRI